MAAWREVLEGLAKLGNEPFEGTSEGNTRAQRALRTGIGREEAAVIAAAVEWEYGWRTDRVYSFDDRCTRLARAVEALRKKREG